LYIADIVVFLTAFSTRVSVPSSEIHNREDTPKDWQYGGRCSIPDRRRVFLSLQTSRQKKPSGTEGSFLGRRAATAWNWRFVPHCRSSECVVWCIIVFFFINDLRTFEVIGNYSLWI